MSLGCLAYDPLCPKQASSKPFGPGPEESEKSPERVSKESRFETKIHCAAKKGRQKGIGKKVTKNEKKVTKK